MKKVLVVDDDASIRFMMHEFLDSLGYDHDVVASAGECLSRLMQSPGRYGLVLMDVHMPRITGLDTSSYIRDMEPDPEAGIPIVAVTADEAYQTAEAVRPYGMNGAMAKPVTICALKRLLMTYLCPREQPK